MKAAVYEGIEKIVVRDVPDPVVEEGEVLLKVDACAAFAAAIDGPIVTDMRAFRRRACWGMNSAERSSNRGHQRQSI